MAVLGVAVSASAVAVSGVLGADRREHPPPHGSIVVTGDVRHELRLSVADLAAMPDQQRVEVTFRAGTETERHVFTGPLLIDVLAQAGPRFDPAVENDTLRHYVSVTASDAYGALVAYGELDPSSENKPVLLAVTQDGAPLTDIGPRLVVPGDAAGGRYVTDVARIRLGKPPW